MAYLNERRGMFGRIDGPLFRSASNRNYGKPLGPSTWSKTVEGIAHRAGVARLSTHTFRHLRLTDLARADWTIDQIALYAGHRDLATTMRYIHLSAGARCPAAPRVRIDPAGQGELAGSTGGSPVSATEPPAPASLAQYCAKTAAQSPVLKPEERAALSRLAGLDHQVIHERNRSLWPG